MSDQSRTVSVMRSAWQILHDGVVESAPHRAESASIVARRVHAVGEQHEVEILRRVDPQRRAGKAGVADRARATSACRTTRSAASCPIRGRANCRAPSIAQRTRAATLAVTPSRDRPDPRVEHPPARDIADRGCRAEQPRVSGDAAERGGVLVVDFALEQPAAPRIVFRWARFAIAARVGDDKPIGVDARRAAVRQRSNWSSSDAPARSSRMKPEQDESEIAVDRRGARRVLERLARRSRRSKSAVPRHRAESTGGEPAGRVQCSSRSRVVTASDRPLVHDGRSRNRRVERELRRCDQLARHSVVVAITLVSDARSNIVSTSTRCGVGRHRSAGPRRTASGSRIANRLPR